MARTASSARRLAEIAVWLSAPPMLAIAYSLAPRLLDPRVNHPVEHTIAGILASAAALVLAWHLAWLIVARLARAAAVPRAARRVLAGAVFRLGTDQARALLARGGAAASLGAGLALGALGPAAWATAEPPPDDLSWGAITQTAGPRDDDHTVVPSPSAPSGPGRGPTSVPSPSGAIAVPATPAATAPSTTGGSATGGSAAASPLPAVPTSADEGDPGRRSRDPSPPADASQPTAHTVVPGESLWTIAADLLGPDADDAAIARLWPRLHAQNASTIGADPDLIHPGQVLVLPEVGR